MHKEIIRKRAQRWVADYVGSLDTRALLMAFEAGYTACMQDARFNRGMAALQAVTDEQTADADKAGSAE